MCTTPCVLLPSRITEPAWYLRIDSIVLLATPELGQSTISNCPTRCARLIARSARCAGPPGARGAGLLFGESAGELCGVVMLGVASLEVLVEGGGDVRERCGCGRREVAGATALDVHAPIASTALAHTTT